MDRALIEKHLKTKRLGQKLGLFDRIEYSTNDAVFELAGEGASHGTTVIAGVQENGKGRLGRTWLSGEGSLAMSILLRPDVPAHELPPLTLVCALSVRRAITGFGGNGAVRVKWPNDILVYGKKVCGILLEQRTVSSKNCVVAGIGVNVSQESFPDDLPGAASLRLSGINAEREALAAEVLNHFEEDYEKFVRGGFEPFVSEYTACMVGVGVHADVLDSAASGGDKESAAIAASGVCRGVDTEGRFLLELPDGERLAFAGGEISIRS